MSRRSRRPQLQFSIRAPSLVLAGQAGGRTKWMEGRRGKEERRGGGTKRVPISEVCHLLAFLDRLISIIG